MCSLQADGHWHKTSSLWEHGCWVVYAADNVLLLMQELFSPFGPISRVYIAYDRDTGENRGFAFVNFVYRYAALSDKCKLAVC